MINDIIKALPTEPPKEAFEHYKECIRDQNIIIYQSTMAYFPLEDRRRKAVKCKCTACGDEFIEERYDFQADCFYSRPPAPFGFIDPRTNEPVYEGLDFICPCCGSPVRARHISGTHKDFIVSEYFFNTVHEVNGALCILCWCLRKVADKDGNVKHTVTMCDGNIFKGKTSYTVSAYLKNYNPYTGYTAIYQGYWRKQSYWEDKIGKVHSCDIFPFDQEVLSRSRYENCKLDKFISEIKECHPALYMEIYIKHPNIENLVMCGMSRLVEEKLSSLRGTKSNLSKNMEIDFKESKPYKMLRLNNKTDLLLARRYRFNNEWLLFYADFKDSVSIEEILELKRSKCTYDLRILDIVTSRFDVRLTTVVNYLDKQKKRYGSKYNVIMYKDYISALLNLIDKKEITKEHLFPKNLKTQHDSATQRWAQIQYEQGAEEKKARSLQIEKRAAKLAQFCYQSENLLITPCPSDKALFIEGNTLSHCVYRYSESYANGNTAIFFIRKKDMPEAPYFTLEYSEKDNEILQNRGYDNEAPPKEVVVFAKEWLKYVTKLIKEKQNGKSTCSKSKQHANA